MPAATFDTLKFANALKAAGVPPAQAEAEAHVLAEVLQVNLKDLVTKDDLKLTKEDIQREMADVGKELKQDIKDVKQEVKDAEQRMNTKFEVLVAELKALRAELKGETLLLKWMFGASVTIAVGILIRLYLVRGPL
jgi:ABC-type phosphate transport system auxiliary subunit